MAQSFVLCAQRWLRAHAHNGSSVFTCLERTRGRSLAVECGSKATSRTRVVMHWTGRALSWRCSWTACSTLASPACTWYASVCSPRFHYVSASLRNLAAGWLALCTRLE